MAVYRLYSEKKQGIEAERTAVLFDIKTALQVNGVTEIRVINRYDVEGVDRAVFERAIPVVFSEPPADNVFYELPKLIPGMRVFAVTALRGQYDQRADSAAQCLNIIAEGTPVVKYARVYIITGRIADDDFLKIKAYLINKVEAEECSLDTYETLADYVSSPPDVKFYFRFREFTEEELADFLKEKSLAMDIDDLRCCQEYFRCEDRDPTETEIKMLDTYWSDHCRHTTFGTIITEADIAPAYVREAYEKYLSGKGGNGNGNDEVKPTTLMSIATAAARELKHAGVLDNLDESEEINACSIKVDVPVTSEGVTETQKWLLLFKNETHNHPTEIEPFGGAATCLGGAIRDPLSGRAYVHHAMRVSGSGDPLKPVRDTLKNKLPARKIATTAAAGFSSYGNQIGLATGFVREYYDPGYTAKRLELGAVVGAVREDCVRREVPAEGDRVILLGGRTGRDGIGGATGSSKTHTAASLADCSAEVQKGNAVEERKIQRLFRNPEVTALIKRCNDFGAGGVAVAVGELADGLIIELDAVPKKYEGLGGTELAVSESQERMAVVVERGKADDFIRLAAAENLEATEIAVITAAPRLVMNWRGAKICDISREFLNSNGAKKYARVSVPTADVSYETPWESQSQSGDTDTADKWADMVSDLNICSQKGLVQRFDSTVGAGSVLMPYGGATQTTPAQTMSALFPTEHGRAELAHIMACGYDPDVAKQSPFHGGVTAVVDSAAKVVAGGGKLSDIYFTLQEYFPRTKNDPARWGLPFASLLGAYSAQLGLGRAAIGGKDSMSGTFDVDETREINVPPTLVSFAIAPLKATSVRSSEFTKAHSKIYYILPNYDGDNLPDYASLKDVFAYVSENLDHGIITAARAVENGCIAEAVFKMSLGNRIGAHLVDTDTPLFTKRYGGFVVVADSVLSTLNNDNNFISGYLGATIDEFVIETGEARLELAKLEKAYDQKLEPIYKNKLPIVPEPLTITANYAPPPEDVSSATDTPATDPSRTEPSRTEPSATETQPEQPQPEQPPAEYSCHGEFIDVKPLVFSEHSSIAIIKGIKPTVLIPAFPGTNGEYDMAAAFNDAGGSADIFVIRNLNHYAVSESIGAVVKAAEKAQIIALPGGFSAGDEPEGSAKFITAFLRNAEVTQAVNDLLYKRDGLMLGICNGFQALVKTGLLPYGEIRTATETDPTITFNKIGRHVSQLVYTRMSSVSSPWLMKCELGKVYTVPVSHGEGNFRAAGAVISKLVQGGQVVAQYVVPKQYSGKGRPLPTYDNAYNPNGSDMAIESIMSLDGRILGKMGHSERVPAGGGLFRNVGEIEQQPLFASGIEYFL